jgi:hypothetical protein
VSAAGALIDLAPQLCCHVYSDVNFFFSETIQTHVISGVELDH